MLLVVFSNSKYSDNIIIMILRRQIVKDVLSDKGGGVAVLVSFL